MGVTHSRPRLSPILRAIRATEGLGLTVVGCYDALYRATTSSWEDVRGGSGGPTITLTGSPTLSNGVYTFNGTDQYGRAENGRLGEITQDCGVVVIGGPTTNSGSVLELSAAAVTRVAQMYRSATGVIRFHGGGSVDIGATLNAGNRPFHGRRTGTVGATVAVRQGAGSEATTADTLTATTASRLTLMGSRADSPANLCAGTLAVVVLVAGNPTTTVQAIWNDYGTLRGATA